MSRSQGLACTAARGCGHSTSVAPSVRRTHKDARWTLLAFRRCSSRACAGFLGAPRSYRCPGTHLHMREVVTFCHGRHEPGRHLKQHRHICASRKQLAEGGQHIGVDLAQAAPKLVLQFGDGWGAGCSLEPLERDRARPAPEGQLESGPCRAATPGADRPTRPGPSTPPPRNGERLETR